MLLFQGFVQWVDCWVEGNGWSHYQYASTTLWCFTCQRLASTEFLLHFHHSVFSRRFFIIVLAPVCEKLLFVCSFCPIFFNWTGTPGDWSHIIKQIGMFTFTGLNQEQVSFMTKEYHIYMTSDGWDAFIYRLIKWVSIGMMCILSCFFMFLLWRVLCIPSSLKININMKLQYALFWGLKFSSLFLWIKSPVGVQIGIIVCSSQIYWVTEAGF